MQLLARLLCAHVFNILASVWHAKLQVIQLLDSFLTAPYCSLLILINRTHTQLTCTVAGLQIFFKIGGPK